MAAIDYLTLRSTLMYTAPGVLAPAGSIFTVGSSGMQTMNTTVSTLGASTITVSTLFGSTLFGSTIVASGISLSTLTVSTINGALPGTGSGSGTALTSTMVSIGASTNQTYTFSNGSFTTGWASTLTGTTSIKSVVLSNNGATQTILQNSGSTMSTVITSLDSGFTWTGSTMRGLPTSGALPYQTYGSTINAMTVPSITAITAAPSGTNQLAIASNDLVYSSANSGATFAPQGLGQNNNPFIYIPFDGSSVADVMGNATVTAYGSPAFPPGKVGTNAVNLVNTLNGTTPAAQYVRFPWVTAPPAFTVSFWFNSQTPVSTVSQLLFSSYNYSLYAAISTAGYLYTYFPTGSGTANTIVTNSGIIIAANTWYNVVYVFQTNGTCSLYLNNSLIGSMTNSGGFGGYVSSGIFSIGCPDMTLVGNSFNGYIDDFRIYNYAVTNPSGAALINPLVGPIMPFVYLPFDGSTTTDLMGNSTVTATGSPGFVTGQVGSNALDLSTNTAGGTAGKYLSGTWAGTSNFTVSGWFNAQAIPASSVGMIFSAGTGATTAFQVFITPGGVFTVYSAAAYATSTITTNTWYFFQVVYQSSGTCYVYLNGTQVTTFSGTTLSPIPTIFNIGTYTHTAAVGAFKGYVDDFRIYNGAFTPSQLSPVLYSPSYAIGSPNIYLPFENGSVLDVMGYSAVSARGTMNFVPGVVGSTALNLVNPAGGTPVNYIRGSWAGSPNSTVSLWFNLQSFGSATLTIFSAYQSWLWIAVTTTGLLGVEIPTGGANGGTSFSAMGNITISLNTWYHVVLIFQTNALCSFYVNGSLIGTYTNVGGTGTLPSTQFSLGSYDNFAVSAFNGYIDDFKLYNCAVPFNALSPMNYTQAALSNTGAYQVVAAANGGVYTSANSGSSWSQATLAALQPAASVNTVGGQLITPNLTGLAAATWSQNGVNWAASASSTNPGGGGNFFDAYRMFNNTYGSNSRWVPASFNYTTTGNSSGISNTIIGIAGTPMGDWLQIQSSVPLVMFSYQFANSLNTRLPKTYYITGSNDGSNWYPLQYVSGGAVITTSTNSLIPGVILINSTSTQTFGTSTVATTAYSTSTNAYTYFRLVILTNYSASADNIDIAEWVINFATPATPLYVAPSAVTTVSGGQVITPQQTGLTTATWTQNDVNWVVSASSIYNAMYSAYYAFNNTPTGNNSFASGAKYTTSGTTQADNASTDVVGLSVQVGEWVQLQSSVPLVMNSYIFSCGVAVEYQPKTYIIVGSTDGMTWYPIQSANFSGNPYSTIFTSWQQSLIVNFNGAQTVTAQNTVTATTVTYGSTTNAYTYFRVIATSTNSTIFTLGEWYINFATPLYVVSTATLLANQSLNAITVMPQQTGVASSTWTMHGISWMASASTTLAGGNDAYRAFNNTTGSSAFYTGTFYNGNTGAYNSSVSTAIFGLSAATGEWLQIQSSVPLVMSSYTFACTGWWQLAKTGFIVGSTDGTTWYPIQSFTMTTNPFTANYLTASNYITIGPTGTQTQAIYGNQAGSGSFTGYATSSIAYTYFRFIASTIFGAITNTNTANSDNFGPSEWFINFTAYTPSLLQSLSISPSGQYMALTGAGATAPNSTAAVAATWVANGVTWTSSISSQLGGTPFPYHPFQNANNGDIWISLGNYSSGVYNNTYSTTVQGIPTVFGEWLQIQSSVPLIIASYTFQVFNSGNFPKSYYIVGSSDGTTWYPIQECVFATNPITSTNVKCSNDLLVNFNGIQTLIGNVSSAVTTAASTYATTPYTYFRIIVRGLFSTATNAEIGEWYVNFQSGPTFYSTDYGSSWTRALTAATIPNANVLATSGNDQYSLQASGQTVTLVSNTLAGYLSGTYTTPTFSPVLTVSPVIAAALSLTGQYMVILIQSATNNVYYSTNYGVSFTGLTVGSSPMVSCAISADGSYITVANATQAYTLNRNIQGYSIAVGNQAGLINQAQNAIAIGNQAGLINQSANSIILNASGSALLNSYLSGFYVAPIANYVSSSASFFSILGYGSDSQVVQTGLTALANGNVGIGTTNPGYALHVIGAIYASGNITALSDQRYKQNIVRLDRSLDMICSLNGYFYTRTDYQPGIRQIGLLAQEVNKVIPEAVSYDSANDTYSLNYGCLIAPVIEAVKEINDKVDSRISELEAKIGAQQLLIQTLMDRAR